MQKSVIQQIYHHPTPELLQYCVSLSWYGQLGILNPQSSLWPPGVAETGPKPWIPRGGPATAERPCLECSGLFDFFSGVFFRVAASSLAAFWPFEAPGMEPRSRPNKGGGKGPGGLYSDKARFLRPVCA